MHQPNSHSFDLIIVGGGAAGLMACASAIRSGKTVLLLEKNSKLGVKILMSGGTRCNITHHCDSAGIVNAFIQRGCNGRFLHSPLATLPPTQVVDLIESTGVATKVESTGKVFPVSDRAIDVRDALVKLASDSSGVGRSRIVTGVSCQDIRKSGDQFRISTSQDSFYANSVLLTTGGKSYPGCGTTGDGYAWAEHFGHSIVSPVAALTPITNHNCWSQLLKGITFPDVAISIINENQTAKPLDHDRGGFLFTHFGYSGPAPLNISRTVARNHDPDSLTLICDFVPDQNQEELSENLATLFSDHAKQNLGNVMTQWFPRRFADLLLKNHGYDSTQRAGEVSKSIIRSLVATLKRMRVPINGVYGFKKAEVTAGGVSLNEIDSKTMQSKLCQGLYFAGEIMDLDGPIGGYNFQSAFSTGWLAGQS